MNKNLRKAMISAICMLIVGVMSLTGVTYAWFTESDTATVEGISIGVKTLAGGVLISTDNINFTDRVSWGAEIKNFDPASTAPSAKNGGTLNLFTAECDLAQDPHGEGTAITTGVAVENTNFIKKTFYLQNILAEETTVTLDGSYFDLQNEGKTVGAETAMRIGIIKHGEYTLGKTAPTAGQDGIDIVEPYPGTHISGNTNSGVLKYNGIVEATDTVFDATVAGGNVEEVTPKQLSEATITIGANQCYAITVYIWLEGQDVDCRNAVSGSTLVANICFSAPTQTGDN